MLWLLLDRLPNHSLGFFSLISKTPKLICTVAVSIVTEQSFRRLRLSRPAAALHALQ